MAKTTVDGDNVREEEKKMEEMELMRKYLNEDQVWPPPTKTQSFFP